MNAKTLEKVRAVLVETETDLEDAKFKRNYVRNLHDRLFEVKEARQEVEREIEKAKKPKQQACA